MQSKISKRTLFIMQNRNEQEAFWAEIYAKDYITKNSQFDESLLLRGWEQILRKVKAPSSIVEFGPNIGRNIKALNHFYPEADKTVVEISSEAISVLERNNPNLKIHNASIRESSLIASSYDLSVIMGVLIHIHPDDLLDNVQKVIESSNKYVIVGEYFNRTPVALSYQGQENKLFKCDFGKLILQNFGNEIKLVDYGFLWGHIFDNGGFDDITWWVFEK